MNFKFMFYNLWLVGLIGAIYGKELVYTDLKTSDGSISSQILKQMAVLSGATVFIETGTAGGASTRSALDCFKEIHTVELDRGLYERAVGLFRPYQHVHVYWGDSGKTLMTILPKIQGRVLFFLDAHYSGPGTACGEVMTPIKAELLAIKASGIKDAIIFIDDMVWHHYNYGHERDYPNFVQLIDLLKEINPTYQVVFLGDVMCGLPNDIRISAMTGAIAKFLLPVKVGGWSIVDLKLLERAIKDASAEEKTTIFALQKRYEKNPFCDISPFNFFAGLVCETTGRYRDAFDFYSRAIFLGMNDWSVRWLLARVSKKCGDTRMAVTLSKKVHVEKTDFSEVL